MRRGKARPMPTTAYERGRAIRVGRALLGVTQKQLAAALGVDQTVVSRIEKGSLKYAHHQAPALEMIWAAVSKMDDAKAREVMACFREVTV